MIYSDEQKEIHKAAVRRAIAIDPQISLIRLQKALGEKENIEISIPYIQGVVAQVRSEWIEQYDHETRDIVAARVDEMGSYLIDLLRSIIREEKIVYNKGNSKQAAIISQSNRIQAIKEIRETLKFMIQTKMDLGILNRHLGQLDVDPDITKMRRVLVDLVNLEEEYGTNLELHPGATEETKDNAEVVS